MWLGAILGFCGLRDGPRRSMNRREIVFEMLAYSEAELRGRAFPNRV
jgi:hypothetical protein